MTSKDVTQTVDIVSALISVVILNWNGLRHLPECLGSVELQTFRPLEVILVDNGSSDGSVEYLARHHPSVQVIKNPINYGFSQAANQGILQTKGEFVLLLNNDTRLDENFLSNIMKLWAQADENVIGIIPKALYYDRPTIINSIGAKWRSWRIWKDYADGVEDQGQFDHVQRVFGGAFIAPCLRTELVKKIGLLDELFVSYAEDLDFCYRANSLGFSFITCPQARVYHKSHSTMRDNQIYDLHHHFNRFGLRNCLMGILKNYEAQNLILRFPFALLHLWGYVGILGSLKQFGLKGLPETLRGHALILWELVRALPLLLQKRRVIQRARQVRDVDIWQIGVERILEPHSAAAAPAHLPTSLEGSNSRR
jgi:GT2 family glycosyltransferase